jgi:hypothetical protein
MLRSCLLKFKTILFNKPRIQLRATQLQWKNSDENEICPTNISVDDEYQMICFRAGGGSYKYLQKNTITSFYVLRTKCKENSNGM